jgi:aspartate-semialdehyde dehydrogenase
MKVAVVGATGAVGREMTRILQERDFPVDDFVPLASERSVGRVVRFRGRDHTVGLQTLEALDGVDVALSSCGSATARTWVPGAADAGTVCIDNSSAFRMEPWAELVIPG